MQQSAVFTLLPQDLTADGQLRAALFVSPRLTPDGPGQTVSDFPAFADWPDVVAHSRIVVEKANGQRVAVAPDPTDLRPICGGTTSPTFQSRAGRSTTFHPQKSGRFPHSRYSHWRRAFTMRSQPQAVAITPIRWRVGCAISVRHTERSPATTDSRSPKGGRPGRRGSGRPHQRNYAAGSTQTSTKRSPAGVSGAERRRVRWVTGGRHPRPRRSAPPLHSPIRATRHWISPKHAGSTTGPKPATPRPPTTRHPIPTTSHRPGQRQARCSRRARGAGRSPATPTPPGHHHSVRARP